LQIAEESSAKEAGRARSIAALGEERISTITKERDSLVAQIKDAQRDARESLASIDALQRENDRTRHEIARLNESLNATARERDTLKNEVAGAHALAEKRDQEIQRLGEKIRAHDTQLAEFSTTKSQLANAQRQISSLSEQREVLRVERDSAQTQNAEVRAELARLAEQLRQQRAELREINERATTLERQRNELQRRIDDPALPTQLARITEELTSVNAELGRVRLALESVTAERNQARVEITQQDAALRANAETAFQKDRELAAATTKIETLLRRLEQLEQAKASAEPTREEPAARTSPPTDAIASGHVVDREERYRQLERELAALSERLQSIKTERFALREQLAAKDQEVRKAAPNSEAANQARSELAALQKKLQDLQPAADRARTDYEVLQTKLQAARPPLRDVAATHVLPPAPPPSAGQKAEKLKP
jgi:chromosome segregation ATPase